MKTGDLPVGRVAGSETLPQRVGQRHRHPLTQRVVRERPRPVARRRHRLQLAQVRIRVRCLMALVVTHQDDPPSLVVFVVHLLPRAAIIVKSVHKTQWNEGSYFLDLFK